MSRPKCVYPVNDCKGRVTHAWVRRDNTYVLSCKNHANGIRERMKRGMPGRLIWIGEPEWMELVLSGQIRQVKY